MGFSASRSVRKGIAESLGGQSGDRQYQFNSASCRGVVLAQSAKQPELERPGLLEAIPADQGTVSSAATQAASPLWGAASSSHNAVNQLLTSLVREIRTLRFVGAGGGRTSGHPMVSRK